MKFISKDKYLRKKEEKNNNWRKGKFVKRKRRAKRDTHKEKRSHLRLNLQDPGEYQEEQEIHRFNI